MNQTTTVVVGMSGGVDSSVAALLLKEQGYKVIALFMKNWDEVDANGVCSADEDYRDVIRVCEKLDIAYYSVNLVEEYEKKVFADFLEEYKKGVTPNPDVLCNREIKFQLFWERAKLLGADKLATGHYARLSNNRLTKAHDLTKDQSYFLSQVDPAVWPNILFPLGDLTKKEVRAIAEKHGLATHNKKDSTGICFIGERNFKPFLKQYIQEMRGNFVDLSGKKLGPHDGLCFYTLGQRKGLGIGGPGEAWFVAGKNRSSNEVILVQGERHPALYTDELRANSVCFQVPVENLNFPLKCQAKVRYRQEDQACTVNFINDEFVVSFDEPQRAVTPGQVLVLYLNGSCLGSGFISEVGATYYAQNKTLALSALSLS